MFYVGVLFVLGTLLSSPTTALCDTQPITDDPDKQNTFIASKKSIALVLIVTFVAVLKTGVLAIAGVLLALGSRWTRLSEAAWLVYPVLIVGGGKLLLEDFPNGRPATLVLSLTLYGGALILAPRLRRPVVDAERAEDAVITVPPRSRR